MTTIILLPSPPSPARGVVAEFPQYVQLQNGNCQSGEKPLSLSLSFSLAAGACSVALVRRAATN